MRPNVVVPRRRFRWHAAPLAVLLLSGSVGGCGPAPDLPGPDIVARLGDEQLPLPRFEAYLKRNAGSEAEALPSAALSGLFDQFVREELLLRLARDRGVAREGDDRRRALDALLAAGGALAPGRAEVESYYRAHLDEFRLPERVRLRQLLANDRRVAERARRELVAGADFETVIARAAAAGGGLQGGPQGDLARDELPQAFAELIFRLAPGETSAVVEAEYGFHVFRVEERLPARTATLDEAAPAIERDLAGKAADRRLAALEEEARRAYPPTVYDRNLPFEYRGTLPVSRPYEKR
ncbi:MAG: peptidyl-prolyl cis-trans isomerase [Holophagales bacterium]|nr:MAG: peptidyl-prolyl cis-trans isomerase [Holophagales bacterium]